VSSYESASSRGNPRNKVLFLDHPLKSSIGLSQLLVRFSGLAIFSMTSAFSLIHHWFSIVTTRAARHIAQNPSFDEQTKHIDINCHVICQRLQNNLFRLLPISSNDQLADIFTKALHCTNFKLNVHKLGMLSIHHPA